MHKKEHISMSVVRRLPRYYRFLKELNQNGETRTSSKELSRRMGFTASQIRQDFNCFGGFGQQGYGYNVAVLCDEIEKILGLRHKHSCILIGAGNLGRTIATHVPFDQLGFSLIGIFDRNPSLHGQKISSLEIMDNRCIPDFAAKHTPTMAVLCLPKTAIPDIVWTLHEMGIKNYWNFSHYNITLKYPDTIVENVHINESLMTLCYKVSETLEV